MMIEELIEIVRTDYLDDTISKKLHDDNFMLRSFSEAQRQACNRWECLFDNTTDSITRFVIASDKDVYQLDRRILRIDRCLLNDKEIEQRSIEEMDRTDPGWRLYTGLTNKQPLFVVRGRGLRLIPSPALADDGGELRIEVYRLPIVERFTDIHEIPEIPSEFHRDLIWWVLGEAYSKRDEDVLDEETGMRTSSRYFSRFEDVFGPYVSANTRKVQLEQPRSVVIRPEEYTPSQWKFDDTDIEAA